MRSRSMVSLVAFLAVAFTGCSAAEQTSYAATQTTGATGADAPPAERVRISRAFFEKSIVGTLRVENTETQKTVEASSDVTWTVYEPTMPLPQDREVLFDMRDRQGCAIYDDTQGVRLCFNVMPDVSSLGVNADEVTLQGAQEFIAANSGCKIDFRFASATRDEDALKVTFVSQAAAGTPEECQALRPVRVDVTLQQL